MKDRDFIKIQKKNLQIWSLYDQEEPITNYNYRLKRKKKVRAASFVRHVAQRTRVITPARGFDPWRSRSTNWVPPRGHEMSFRIYKMASSFQHDHSISSTGIACVLSAVRWWFRFLLCAPFLVYVFWTGGKIKPENNGQKLCHQGMRT